MYELLLCCELPVCEEIQPVHPGRSRLLGKRATFLLSRVLSVLCTCADNHPLVWLYVRKHHVVSVCVYAHVFSHCYTWASRCAFVSISRRACGCLCVFHAEHCLLETLSKSPQCDNWLPGVLVSLLLIIVIPSRKKVCVCVCALDEIGEVCSFAGETDPKSAWTLLARRNFEAMRQRGQIRCNLPAGCYLLSTWHQGLVFRQT